MVLIHIFWYKTIFLKKDKTSSILTFLNRLLKLFTLKNCFLTRVKSLHSMRMSLMVQGVWHVKHCGDCSYFNIIECKFCMTNMQLGYNDLFSCYSESWSQSGLDLEELVVDVIPALLPFCMKEFVDFGFQVSIQNPKFVEGQI